MDLDADRRHPSQKERYLEPGCNARLSDIQAAVGRVQLGRLDELVARRRYLAEGYRQRLGSIEGLRLPQEPAGARTNWQSFCVTLPDHAVQSLVITALARRGIASRPGVMCAHREPAYPAGTWSCRPGQARCECGDSCSRLRNSELAQDRGLLLPLFAQMTDDDQDRVAAALASACAAEA